MGLEAKLIAYALAAAAILAGAWALAEHFVGVGRAEVQAKWDAAQDAEHQRVAKENFRRNELAADVATKQAEQKVIYATITKTVDRVVERPVYRSDCIDGDGLSSINAALAGAAPGAGQPDAAVPAAVAASGADGR